MKKIRILSLVIAAITLLTLCACNPGGNTPAQSSADPAETTATPTEQTSASTTQAPETTKKPETTKAPEISTEPEQTYATPATVDGVYQLSTIDDLFWFMEDGPRDGKYALTNDIVFNDVANIAEWSIENQPKNVWNPIGNTFAPFSGSFNGNGHTITGLYVLGAGNVGMFGACTNAVIENIIIASGRVLSTDSNTGAFIGTYDGTDNVLRNCVNNADVYGYAYVGGLVGKYISYPGSNILIENCVNRGSVTGSKPAAAVYVGGIIPAVIGAQVKNCANFGTIMAGLLDNPLYETSGCALVGGIGGVMGGSKSENDLISNCYNAGTVISCNYGLNSNKGTAAAGGIIGRMNGTTDVCKIENCYSTGNVYTLSAESLQVSATCVTKSGVDYASNVYTSGKVLVWKTEAENPNAQIPACGSPEVNTGIGAVSAMNLDPLVWTDSLDGAPILSSIPAEYQLPLSN